jgi:hypothetical protein
MDDGKASDEEVAARCRELRQGDVMNLGYLPIMHPDAVHEQRYSRGAAVITQTCDLVQPHRPNAVVAPIVELDPSNAGNAKRGAMPQYVHLAHPTEDNLFVDLAHCATLTKATLARQELLHRGVDQEDREAVGKFAARVGRRFSRFPFPDEVQPWFRPLQTEVARRHGKDTPVGRLLQDVVDIRIQSSAWNSSRMDLTIHVIVPAGTVPHPDDFDPDDIPHALSSQLRPNGLLTATAAQIAVRLLPQGPARAGLTAPERYLLWNAFAEALANMCKRPEGSVVPVLSAVASVTGILWTDDEFSLNLYNRTESLDLEHLSPSIPIFDSASQ